MPPRSIAFFGSSLVSAYWNGAATYYRGVLSALHARGFAVTFYEPDAYDRQQHRDLAEDPGYARVVVYPNRPDALAPLLEEAAAAGVVVKASGVGVFDAELEEAVSTLTRADGSAPLRIFWDVDAPATLERMRADPDDPARACVPRYDAVFTYGGGPPVVAAYEALGARRCVPIYNAHDPATHRPAPAQERFACDLCFLGNRLPDREARVDAFFTEAARLAPAKKFLLGGSGWHDADLPENVHRLGHVGTGDHNALNASALCVLNISRASMAEVGFSPATRVFEAAAAGACLVTDAWVGIDTFFEPGVEILVAEDGAGVAAILADLRPERARDIGDAARARALRDHTYTQRAVTVEAQLDELAEHAS
ncbi:CgeB family protein [Phycisphaera mikurensis]|uniref:Spore protein YkvP/CgeB glycosyl transferase-like domain-containing protein n=1 Tax=Phycisphaera mikurensis (strain NBRC 102666 / KCTC 22515 / FYK2301M01) TaxID=1142394 RepID=I0IA78_PHYMF|nr:glycosyltransferase [Phycisphaera mikurensis]MBB6441832.1 spore maturation protein CgeB [Phycisphaera mikurensis]BAM02166.1 hypothetical protein PSMK_00070 [Phycisphaera mikurensis NBRC 102666]